MKNYLLIFPIAFALCACGGNQSQEATQPAVESIVVEQVEEPVASETTYDYTVINREESSMDLPGGQQVKKLRVVVEIPIEYSELGLNDIADVIKKHNPYEYLFVEFYLTSQPKTGPNYGIVKRTPSENSVVINYVAPPKEPEQKSQAAAPAVKKPYDGCKVYGAWNMMGAKVIAYSKNGKCYMVNYYGGTNYGEPERYIKTTYGGRTAFKNAEDPADMYVINQYGDLDGYYEGDHASTFSQTTY